MMYLAYVLLTLHMFLGIFLIGLILLQRGRGGGLAGSFGGMGGQSAFGTKAGDIFTRITIVVAVIWILLACICILVVASATQGKATFVGKGKAPVKTAPADDPGAEKDDLPANDKKPGNGAAADDNDSAVLPSPGKVDSPKDGEKKPDDPNDEGAAADKKPGGAEANPAAANKDAPANKKEPAVPEKTDPKQPE